jgi:hypothetical protein
VYAFSSFSCIILIVSLLLFLVLHFLILIPNVFAIQDFCYSMTRNNSLPPSPNCMMLDNLESLLTMNWTTGSQISGGRWAFLFSTISRECLNSTQPLTWISRVHFLDMKQSGGQRVKLMSSNLRLVPTLIMNTTLPSLSHVSSRAGVFKH